jgi:short-subunit dehydrogenase
MSIHQTSKTALVTGASGGIGQVIAEQFATSGVNLIVAARGAEQLEALAKRWRAQHGIQVTVIVSDLSQAGAAQALADSVLDQGLEIDYLVNNAGRGGYGLFSDSDLDDELSMMRLNMEALVVLTKRFLPGLIARQGKILNVASTASFQPGPYMAVYFATKAYVLSFSEALSAELDGTGVTVTALCPGPTATGFQDKAAMHDSGLTKGKRLPSAEEVGLAGYRAMQKGRRVYIPGAMNWLMAQAVRFTPRNLVTTLTKHMAKPA